MPKQTENILVILVFYIWYVKTNHRCHLIFAIIRLFFVQNRLLLIIDHSKNIDQHQLNATIESL